MEDIFLCRINYRKERKSSLPTNVYHTERRRMNFDAMSQTEKHGDERCFVHEPIMFHEIKQMRNYSGSQTT